MGKIIIHKDIKQQTDEWYEIKKLKMSASHANTIMAAGKGLETYVNELVAEHFSTGERESYTNANMERGNLFEDQARTLYELEKDCVVEQVGFIELEGGYVGVSPDGLVDEDGLVEIKNHSDRVFIELLLSQKIKKEYLDQMQMQMFVSGRKWCDYMGYNPNIKPYKYIQRILPCPEAFEKLESGLALGKKKLIETVEKIEEIANCKP